MDSNFQSSNNCVKKDFPPIEQSLKYLAWSFKEISENFSKITAFLGSIDNTLKNLQKIELSKVDMSKLTKQNHDDIPF